VQNQVNSIKSFFFQYTFLIIMTTSGFISIALFMNKGEAKFAEYALEGLFLTYSSLAIWWAKRNEFLASITFVRWTCLGYLGLSYIYAVQIKGANVEDFLLIYKSFIYLFFLSLLAGKKLMTYEGTNRLFFILLGLFFIKYVAMIVVKGDDRPILYMENNFELMLLYALFLIRYTVTKEKAMMLLGLVGLITILSLSRSCLLMFSVLVIFVFYDSYKKTRVFIIPGAILILGGVILFIFSQRDSSLEDIDRFKFMLVWWSQVKDWSLFEWLFGAPRITNLTPNACMFFMHWYDTLFSRSGNGTCYSVVFHSFLLRAIYDHGILGLVFIIFASYKLLTVSGVKKIVAWVFVTIVIINGLSVSSFNNLFFAISTVFLMATNTVFANLVSDEIDEEKEEEFVPKQLV
jgi:hypothetical protein